jgi:valyl-tRNA synthetase
MPFVTEELWHAMGERSHDLILARWPSPDARSLDPAASADVEWLIGLISAVRSARADLGISPGLTIEYLADPSAETSRRLESAAAELQRLARFTPASERKQGAAMQIIHDGETYSVPLEGSIDLAAERARLTRDHAAAEKERDALAARLANASFVERAKPEAVEKARADHAERQGEAERLAAALARLG